MSQLFTNNATSLTDANFEIGDTTLNLASGFGALFPSLSPTSGDFFLCSIEDSSGNLEILQCNTRVGDALTVQRARESTAELQFLTGARVECRLTAGTFDNFLQRAGGVMDGELDLNGNVLRDPLITDGEIRNTPIRGTDGGTGNQIVVPTAGGAPTIGGNVIFHGGNDGIGSSLDADLLDGQEGAFYTSYAEDASNINVGTLNRIRLPEQVAFKDLVNNFEAGQYTLEVDITAVASTVLDALDSNSFDIFMAVNITTFTLNNMNPGQVISIVFRQNAGGETCAFPGAWLWKDGTIPVLSTSAGEHDILTLMRINSLIYANLLKDFA